MARTLAFNFRGTEFKLGIERIDRSKLYGSVDVRTLDQDGHACSLATLASDGRTLIGSGGTAMGYMNPDGEWLDRSDLKAVDLTGEPLASVESSFKLTTELVSEATIEDYLDHNIRLCYALQPDDKLPEALLKELADGKIFKFGFSYRGGVDPDTAFLLMDEANEPWMMVAEQSDLEPVGLEQAAVCGNNRSGDQDEEEAGEAADALDFGAL